MCKTKKEGTFDCLKDFDFPGVYLIISQEDEVVYVGSSYARTIKERLEQYLTRSKTGNTLMREICSKDYDISKASKIKQEDIDKAIEQIKTFKIIAIRHEDLEYKLIKEKKPKYNKVGKPLED